MFAAAPFPPADLNANNRVTQNAVLLLCAQADLRGNHETRENMDGPQYLQKELQASTVLSAEAKL
jgi:hypothetical protein